MNNTISCQTNITYTKNLYSANLEQIFELIRNGYNGALDLRPATQQIQTLSDHDEQNKLKCSLLPYACFNGVFTQRNNDGLIEYSSYTAIDFDGFKNEEELQRMIANLRTTSFVRFLFRSPSGRGIKAIVEHNNTNPKKHYALYLELMDALNVPELDPKTSDLSRATFLCYDPNAIWNDYCQPYRFEENKYPEKDFTAQSQTSSHNRTSGIIVDFDSLVLTTPTNITDGSIQRILSTWLKKEKIAEGNRNDTLYRYACVLCKAGVKWEYTMDWLKEKFAPLGISNEEISRTASSAYTRFSSVFGCERDNKFGGKKK